MKLVTPRTWTRSGQQCAQWGVTAVESPLRARLLVHSFLGLVLFGTISAQATTRLFGIQPSIAADAEVQELNPADCSTIRSLRAPIQPGYGFFGGLAYDGHSLWYSLLGDGSVRLVELNAESGAIRSVREIPFPYVSGLAAMNGLLYLLAGPSILVYDPETDSIVGGIPIGQVNPGVHFDLALDQIARSGRLLVGGSYDNGLPDHFFEIDVATGLIVRAYSDPGNFVTGLAVVDDWIFASQYFQDLYVFDLQGEFLFTCPTARGFTGLAAGESERSVVQIPAISTLGLALLAFGTVAAAWHAMRDRSAFR